MKLSATAGYWSSGPPPAAPDLFIEAERMGFAQLWTAGSPIADQLGAAIGTEFGSKFGGTYNPTNVYQRLLLGEFGDMIANNRGDQLDNALTQIIRLEPFDPAAGTGGVLVEAYNHLGRQVKTVAHRRLLQEESLFGCEPKSLPYLASLCVPGSDRAKRDHLASVRDRDPWLVWLHGLVYPRSKKKRFATSRHAPGPRA